MYENGVIARCAHSGGILSVVFYTTLTVGEEDVRSGVDAVGDALAAVVG
jgi:hypothetical protein